MYNKIPNIQPDKYYSKVINKKKIIDFLTTETNIDKIEKYVEHNALVLKNYPNLKIEDVIDIMEYSNYRLNKLKGLDKINEIYEETKKEVSNLNSIEVIYTPLEINDKNKEGFRHAVTYVKINDELYEVRNVNKVISFLGNKEILKDLSEYEIQKLIKENSDLIKTNYLNRQEEITSEQVEEEIKNESDTKIRNALENHIDDVVKERQKLEEYINKTNPGASVIYGVNSNEERIYTVGDKLIKFEGKNRELQILASSEIEKMRTGRFDNIQEYDEELTQKTLYSIKDFEVYENKLTEIIERQYNEVIIPNDKLEFLINFLEVWITAKENEEEIIENLNMVAQEWYEKVNIDPSILETSQELYKIFDRIKEYKKNYDKSKMLEVPEMNNAAFVSIFVILESSLIIGFVVALLRLFK